MSKSRAHWESRRACFWIAALALWMAGPLPAVEKVSPELRRRAEQEPVLPVFVVLRNQPHKQILERVNRASRLRILIAKSEYDRWSATAFARDEEVAAARDRFEAAVVEARQAAGAEIEAALRPDQDLMETRLAAMGATAMHRYTAINMLSALVPSPALAALEADPDVAEVLPDDEQHDSLDVSVPALGAPAFWNAGFTGAGQSVGVLDTGIKPDHPAFAGTTIVSRTFLSHGSQSSCFGDDASTTADLQGHGTHVSGIIAGVGAPGLERVQGVARGLGKLYSLKIGYRKKPTPECKDAGNCYISDVMEALDWAVRNSPVRIFNYSYRGEVRQDDDSTARLFDRMADTYGLTIVVAAGNDGPGQSTLGTPGIGYNVITIANEDTHGTADRADDDVYPGSSRGPTAGGRYKPDIAAPGTAILSADARSNGFLRMTGTSMAAPHIAGSAALLMQAGATDPLAIKALLINTADGSGWSPDRGWGFANLARLRSSLNYFSGTAPAGAYRLYKGGAAGSLKSTLVWNRHLRADAGGAAPLSSFGLYVYDRLSGAPLGRAEAASENVMQVEAGTSGDVVVKVKALSVSAGDEAFALALSADGFSAARGPALLAACSPPAQVPVNATFQVTCTASNGGDLDAGGVTGSIAAPPGFTTSEPQSFGTIAASGGISRTWLVTTPATPGTYSFQMTLASASFGELFQANTSFTVTVSRDAPSLSATQKALAFSYDAGGGPPSAQSVDLRSSGAPLPFTAFTTAPWLIAGPANSATPSTLQLSINPAGLANGVYTGWAVISSTGSTASLQTVAVTLKVDGVPQIAVGDRMLTAALDTREKGCSPPVPATVFRTSDPQASLWFTAGNLQPGEQPVVEWNDPTGTVYRSAPLDPIGPADGANQCFSDTFPIAGTDAASVSGKWTAKLWLNGVQVFSLDFTIVPPDPGTAPGSGG